ncbi:MAG: FAD-dependent oxidoreductase, partial [Deltaproteobacteria bacterium]|nr:FAD-dependent oxidoreductase [Deltaproteobacteria bacterium]
MSEEKKKVVVLGAGVTGLGTAYRLSREGGFDIEVLDKDDSVGGLCRSFREGDFILDYGPHKFYTLLDGILDEFKQLMGDELLEREKTQNLYMNEKYYSFPLKMSEMVKNFPPTKSAGILLSYAAQILKNFIHSTNSRSYEEFIVERFGQGLYQQIFAPMAKKIYGPPEKLDRKLAEVR